MNKRQLIKDIETASMLCWTMRVPEKKFAAVLIKNGLPPSEEYMEDRLKELSVDQLTTVHSELVELLDKQKRKN